MSATARRSEEHPGTNGATVGRAAVAAAPHPTAAAVLALQRDAGNRAVAGLIAGGRTTPFAAATAAGPTLARTDQRAGTGELSNRQLQQIDAAMHPTTATAPGAPARQWDGAATQPDHAQRRAELQSEMTQAMVAWLNQQMPGIRAQADPARTPREHVRTMAGAGRAAKRIVDDLFGAWASAAALTAPVAHQRAAFDFDPGTELIDRSDPAQFSTNVADLADWIAQTAPASTAAQGRHGFDKDRSPEERRWLENDVLRPFVNAHRADLDLYDRYGFLDTTRRRISVVPTLVQGGSTAPGPGGRPSEALRRQQWANWQYLAHEYIHTLEHPAFEEARGGNRVLFEGFCEHFTLQALQRWVPIARSDSDPALRAEVEGTQPDGSLWPGFQARWVATPNAGAYAAYVRQTRRIRDIIGSGGENALRGAFFQGHVELIGLDPSGDIRSTPLDLRDQVQVPAGIHTRAELATASGVTEEVIARRNPALTASSSPVRFGQHVVLPGCREHVIVRADPTHDVPGGASVIESPAQIARQHGITEADLRRANPAVNWSGLRMGDHVLVPRR